MDEILASIRRIIADDQEGMRGFADDKPSDASPLTNVLDLAERQNVPLSRPAHLSFEDEDDILGEEENLDDEMPDDEPPFGASTSAFVRSHEPEPPAYTPGITRIPETVSAPSPQKAALVSEVREAPVARKPASEGPMPDNLLSNAADESVASAFTRLGSTLMPSNPRTLEDVVADMLRPMLKEWLDDNLPPLVERLVQAEIERISRSRR